MMRLNLADGNTGRIAEFLFKCDGVAVYDTRVRPSGPET